MGRGILKRIYKRKQVHSNLSVLWALAVNKEVGDLISMGDVTELQRWNTTYSTAVHI